MESGKKTFEFNENDSEYLIKLKGRKWRWLLLLLLLLPLLFLIKCEKDITVIVLYSDSIPAINTDVNLKYTERELLHFNPTILGYKYFDSQNQTTDSSGIVYFKKLKCSLYGYLFHSSDSLYINIDGLDCYNSGGYAKKYKEVSDGEEIIINLIERTINLDFTVHSKQDSMLLVDANVILKYKKNGISKEQQDTSDASGKVYFENVTLCSELTITASCDGYYDTTLVVESIEDIANELQKREIYLRPIFATVKFVVKNYENKSPIALATVKVCNETGSCSEKKTNINGEVGMAIFDNLFVKSNLEVTAKCIHYKDTLQPLKGTVEYFKDADIDNRTLWLVPVTNDCNLRIVDKETGQPISGAEVEVSQDGKKEIYTTAIDGIVVVGAFCGGLLDVKVTKNGYEINTEINGKNCCELAKEYSDGIVIIPLKPLKSKITFIVLDCKTNEPIEDVNLNISEFRNSYSLNTDSDGKADVELSDIATIKLNAIRDCYESKTIETLSVEFLKSSNPYTLCLNPTYCTCKFQVIDGNTKLPLSDAKLTLKTIDQTIELISDANGYVTFENLLCENPISIEVEKEGFDTKIAISGQNCCDLASLNPTGTIIELPIKTVPITFTLTPCTVGERDIFDIYIDGVNYGTWDSGNDEHDFATWTKTINLTKGNHIFELKITNKIEKCTCPTIDIAPNILSSTTINREKNRFNFVVM